MRRRTTPPARGPAADGRVFGLGVASAAAAVLTWVLQAVAGRMLGPESYAAFMVVWGFVFLEVGLLQGLQQEVNRAVAADPAGAPSDSPVGRTMRLGLLLGAAGGAAGLATAPVWGGRVFGGAWFPVTLATSFGFLAYALYNVMNGGLAGRQRWTDYSTSLATEGLLRFALVLVALLAGGGLTAQAWALSAAGLTWLVLFGRRGFRAAAREQGDRSLPVMANGALHAMVATGCSAILVAGFPVLLRLTASAPLPPEAGVVLAAVVATRAPLLLPLNAFQAVVLTRFVLARNRIMRALGRLLAAVTLATVAGTGLAYLVGPQLLRLLYGSQFQIGSVLIAVLVTGAGLITMLTLSGTALMALGHHRLFAVGWLLATAVAVAVLMSDLSVGTRSALALTVGPLAGLAFNTAALAVRRPG